MGRSRKKKKVQDLKVVGLADKGRGVAKDEAGNVYFIAAVAPGDVVDVIVTRNKKSFKEAKVLEYKTLSPDRIEAKCAHFGACGGCKYQHIPYQLQLKYKEERVQDQIKRIGKIDTDIQPILACDEPFEYRNKTEFSFSPKKWLPKEALNTEESNLQDVLGFHAPGTFDKIVDIQQCHLQGDGTNELRLFAKQLAVEQELPFYDMRSHQGFMRSMVIRNTTLGQKMVIFSFASPDMTKINAYLNAFQEKFSLKSLYYCINTKLNDFIFDLDMVLFDGKPFIEEKLGDITFQIGPKSFFQTNTKQAEKLYDQVEQFAQLDGTQNVYDLYTGLGSIALFLAAKCKHVVGIEEVESAIEDANLNKKRNAIDNATFYAGDVQHILTTEFAKQHGKPDVLISDPPRAGMHPKVVEMLLELEAAKIVYVSCNPATQARDLNLLSEKYTVKAVKPVDMFPQTYHTESVALLELR